MQPGRATTIVASLIVALGMAAFLAHDALADAVRLVVVPPFKGEIPYPPVLLGVQQALIDDLRALWDTQVMTREEMASVLSAGGQSRKKNLYMTEIPKWRSTFNTRFVLMNDLRENLGSLEWQVKLVNGTTGAVENTWKLQGSLEHILQVKDQAVVAIRTILPGAKSQGEVRTSAGHAEDQLSALAAFARGLEALDGKDYVTAVQQWRQALQRDATFLYATRQLELLRARLKTERTSPRELGLFLLADEQSEQAEGHLQEALRQNGNDAKVLLALSQIALDQKNYKVARQHAVKARDLEKTSAQPWRLLGKIAQAEGKEREASEMLQKAGELAPTNADLYQALAEVYAKVGDQDKAGTAYRQAGELYTAALRVQEARTVFAEVKKLTPQATAYLIGEGDLWRRVGQPRKALTAYEQAQVIEPNNAVIVQKTGTMYQQLGEMQAAVAHYQHALSLSADDFEANLQMGRLRVQAGQYGSALPYLHKAKQLQPGRADVQKLLAQVYAGMGKKDLALQEYRDVLRAGSDDAESYKAYGDVLVEKGHLAQAELQYEQAVKLNPDFSSAYEGLGRVRQKLGKRAEATAALAQAQLLNADGPPLPQEEASGQGGVTPLIASFPVTHGQGGVVKVASIDLEVFVEKRGFIRQMSSHILGFLRIRKADIRTIKNDFENALQQKYQKVPFDRIEKILNIKPYKSMNPENLNDIKYLAGLCDAFDVHALIFYRIVNDGISDGKYRIVIKEVLFEKSSASLWSNEASLEYQKEQIEYVNMPYILILMLIPLAALSYVCVYLVKGFGSVVVSIHQDSSRRKAFFSVVLSKKSNMDLAKTKKNLIKIVKGATKGGKYEREVRHGIYERSMVVNETVFPHIRVGEYYVYLFGVITETNGEEIGNYQLTQKVKIEKNQKHALVFDLRPQTSRVTIQVLHGQAVAKGAEVAIKGQSESRYVKDEIGPAFRLPVGSYTVVVHYEGQLFTQDVEITTLEKNFHFTFHLPLTLTGAVEQA